MLYARIELIKEALPTEEGPVLAALGRGNKMRLTEDDSDFIAAIHEHSSRVEQFESGFCDWQLLRCPLWLFWPGAFSCLMLR